VTTENLPPCGWKNSCRQSFVGKTGAKAIYSYGHRNPQGLASNYRSYLGSRARTERRRNQHHKKGANYGWPVVTYGIDYDGTTISDQKPGIEDPIYYWVPSIAPAE
jgi:glucose/arabinose dehydrogenase